MDQKLDAQVERLFTLIKEKLDIEGGSIKLIEEVRADEELIKASNSYCMQCGWCCNKRCANKELRNDGLVYCLLHDNSEKYLPKKKTPGYKEIYRKLNPKKYTKPKTCHTSGPYLVLPALIYYKEGKNWAMFRETQRECRGAVKMLRDYEEFLSK